MAKKTGAKPYVGIDKNVLVALIGKCTAIKSDITKATGDLGAADKSGDDDPARANVDRVRRDIKQLKVVSTDAGSPAHA